MQIAHRKPNGIGNSNASSESYYPAAGSTCLDEVKEAIAMARDISSMQVDASLNLNEALLENTIEDW